MQPKTNPLVPLFVKVAFAPAPFRNVNTLVVSTSKQDITLVVLSVVNAVIAACFVAGVIAAGSPVNVQAVVLLVAVTAGMKRVTTLLVIE